jgi:hypothetical protein
MKDKHQHKNSNQVGLMCFLEIGILYFMDL